MIKLTSAGSSKDHRFNWALGIFDEALQIAESSEEFKINTDTDNQLKYALKLLNG